jgi:hypothetical protein
MASYVDVDPNQKFDPFYEKPTPDPALVPPALRKPEFQVKDSGVRHEFESGMRRDTSDNKTDVELIFNGPMADRWAEHLTKGAIKYPDPEIGEANWMRANGKAEMVRFRKSAVRHFRQWLRGDIDEDHASAVFFNINGYEYTKGKLDDDNRSQPSRDVG